VFKPHTSDSNDCHPNIENDIQRQLASPFQLELPLNKFTPKQVQQKIQRHINPKKSPGHDHISGKILKELSKKGIIYLTQIYNAVLQTAYFPQTWKIAQIILIPKPGKPMEDLSSYRPISLLPIMSKVFEKLLLDRLLPIITEWA
jgi:hypothetical protein